MANQQNYQNHTRWFPLFHFILMPLLLVLMIWTAVCVFMEFEWWRLQLLLLTIALVVSSFAARLQALKAQDRLIRLEESIRYDRVLPFGLAAEAKGLRLGHIVALRFSSDEELADLVARTIRGEFGSTKEIKLAIKNWRADHVRV
ncbi:MAG: DUF6526 family protein [bacterium]|nr:DUF6526 family protein [bacterium]